VRTAQAVPEREARDGLWDPCNSLPHRSDPGSPRMLNPLLLYWFGRALMMAHRREMPDDPILYTFRDGASRTTVAAMICIMLAAI